MVDDAQQANIPASQPNAYGPPAGKPAAQPRTLSHYEIVDRHEKKTVGTAKSLRGALRSVDRRDNAYGGYRYTHRAVYKD